MMNKALYVAAIVVPVTGCSSLGAPTASSDAYLAKSDDSRSIMMTPSSLDSPQARKAVDEDFNRAMEICDSEMGQLKDSFTGSGKKELGLAAVGIIAGSIIVPTLAAKTMAAKSAIAGWGGIAGAANAAQYTLHQKGASAASFSVLYMELRKEIQKTTADYVTAGTVAEKRDAIVRLSTFCRYPPLAEVGAPPAPAPAPAPAPEK